MKTVAIVPARAGSKRITDKNVRPLAGKPLVCWTVEACLAAQSIDRVILSTDSDAYWETVTERYPGDQLRLDRRSPQEAGDQVKIFDYLIDAREKLFQDDETVFVLTLPTVPFRTSRHIDDAVALHRSTGKAVFTASTYSFPISFAFTGDEQQQWTPVFDDSPMQTGNTRSQNQAKTLHPNGAVYVRKVADLTPGAISTLYDNALYVEMDPEDSIDIDNELDFTLAEAVLAYRNGQQDPG